MRMRTREVIGPAPSWAVDHAAVVAAGEQPDRCQRADHAALGTAEPLQVHPGRGGDPARVGL